MAHHVETIMAAIVTKLTGLTTTGANVFRGRDNPLPDSISAGLLIWQGPDDVLEEFTQGVIHAELTVFIDAMVKSTSAQIDTLCNTIRLEVTRALAADRDLGLPAIVISIEEESTDEPEISGEGDQVAAAMRQTWLVTYQYTRTDPET